MAALDSQALAAFVAVARHQSFSLAAEQLHITQPAVSKRIAMLEQQLGHPLFDRIRKRVLLTEAGEALLPRAQKLLLDMQDAVQVINDLDDGVTGELGIAFSHHIGLHRLPPYLQQFSQQHPGTRLNVNFIDSETAYSLLRNGEIELAVITLSPEHIAEMVTTPLWRDPLAFVCSPDHELHLANHVGLERLARLDAILPDLNTFTGKLVHELFRSESLALTTSMTTNYLETIKMMVSIGLGWSVLPKTMTAGLEEIHVPDHYIERQLGVVQLRGRRLSNAAQAFRDLLEQGQD